MIALPRPVVIEATWISSSRCKGFSAGRYSSIMPSDGPIMLSGMAATDTFFSIAGLAVRPIWHMSFRVQTLLDRQMFFISLSVIQPMSSCDSISIVEVEEWYETSCSGPVRIMARFKSLTSEQIFSPAISSIRSRLLIPMMAS